jgi:hypothetical protein
MFSFRVCIYILWVFISITYESLKLLTNNNRDTCINFCFHLFSEVLFTVQREINMCGET